jgi:hypothetical protein
MKSLGYLPATYVLVISNNTPIMKKILSINLAKGAPLIYLSITLFLLRKCFAIMSFSFYIEVFTVVFRFFIFRVVLKASLIAMLSAIDKILSN